MFLSYFITDPEYPLNQIFKALDFFKPDFVCYRNKKYFNESEIIKFAKYAKKRSKIFINYDSLKNENLLELFDGVHLPSHALEKIETFKNLNKLVIASTHDEKEAKKAAKADFITFSPVFDSKGRKGLGIKKLNEICEIHPSVIGLGGIVTQKEVNLIKNSKAKGFGSIRYFLHNFM